MCELQRSLRLDRWTYINNYFERTELDKKSKRNQTKFTVFNTNTNRYKHK